MDPDDGNQQRASRGANTRTAENKAEGGAREHDLDPQVGLERGHDVAGPGLAVIVCTTNRTVRWYRSV
jgi:hypothetical protein